MALPSVSIVVVSRGRRNWLRRCLLAIGQLDYTAFEVIVVACPAGFEVAKQVQLPVFARTLSFDRANISAARNLGVKHARGELVAFIDDDAVPEPTWLTHLAAVFNDIDVAQAGGTTLGRNGISVQHGAALVTSEGVTVAVTVHSDSPTVIEPSKDASPRLHGTNMTVRRDVLVEHGGFDERYAFYLDETDLTCRISQGGGKTMFVPKATVHHGVAPSDMRSADRTPKALFEIGASAGVFHQKHTLARDRATAREQFFTERKTWIGMHLRKGTLTPDDATRLISELEEGYANGISRNMKPQECLSEAPIGGIPQKSPNVAEDLFLVARQGTRTYCKDLAHAFVGQGHRVTVFDLSPTTQFHKVRFTERGYWHHTGGIFGRELRSEPLWQWATRGQRIARTLKRLEGIRAKDTLIKAA